MNEILVEAGSERPSSEQQIELALQQAQAKQDPVRARLGFQMYFPEKGAYYQIRDATWKITLPADVEQQVIEGIVAAIGVCLSAIARDGAEAIVEKVRQA